MTEMKIYPTLPTAPSDADYQARYHINTVRAEFDELLRLRTKFNEKHKQYAKILHRLLLINAGSSAISIGSGVGSIAIGATIIGIPVSAGLGGVALAGAISSGIITALIKRYQKKLLKNDKMQGILVQGTAVFEDYHLRKFG